MDWEVKRRFSEFCNFREILIMRYPASIVPKIQKKNINFNQDDKFQMKKRQYILEVIIKNRNFLMIYCNFR